MKKIVSFDPAYSLYFNDLANVIESSLGRYIEKECVSYNYSDRIYLPDYKIVPLGFSELDHDDIIKYDFVGKIKSLNNLGFEEVTQEKKLSNIAIYKWLENYILENKSALFFIYNDLRWNHALAIDILKKNKCKYFVFERGAFRPYSTTMDSEGVNANSKFRNTPVKRIGLKEVTYLENVFFKKRHEKKREVKFFLYFLIKICFAPFIASEVRSASKSKYRKKLRDYVVLFFKTKISNRFLNSSVNNFGCERKYFFVPLQLSNDTQTLINSDFGSTQEFIDFITKNFLNSSLKDSYDLVFKVHPMDTENYNFSKDVIVSNDSTGKLLENSQGCITINSTVGFEGLGNKSVICFGDSFYTDHGFVRKLGKRDNPFLERYSKVSEDNYYYFVLKNYQVPGSIFNYDNDDLEYTAKKILSVLKKV